MIYAVMLVTFGERLGSILRFSDFEILDLEILDGVSHRNCGSPLHDDATIQIWIRHVTSYQKRSKILICPRPRPAPGDGEPSRAPPRAMAMDSEARNNFIWLADDGLHN